MTYDEIGKYLIRNNINAGVGIVGDNPENLLKEVQKAANSGARHIEIGCLEKRSFGFSSSLIEEIRQTGKLSSITFAVHASPNNNPTGFTNRGFSLEERNRAVQEAKSAVDFACRIKDRDKDTVVVIHANSFPRPISDIEPGIFREETIKTYYLVDPATEAVVGAISEQDRVYIPQQAKDNRGRPLWLEDRNRVPIKDSLTGNPIPRLAVDENGRIRGEEITFDEYSRRMKKSGKAQKDITKEVVRLQRVAEINAAYSRLLEAERTLSDAQTRRDKLQDTLDYCREIIRRTPQERWQYERSIPDRLSSLGIPVPQDTRSIIALLEEELAHNQRIIEAARHALTAGWPQFSNVVRELREIVSLEEYGLEVLSEAIAEIAEYCISFSSHGRIRLAIENLPQPQMYGSHLRELWEIIERSREKLSSRLKKSGYSSSESDRLAREYIGATFDIAHLNRFRAFYRGDAFHGWLVSQTKDLARKGVILNLHLSDNRGLDDDHLPLGEGNIPFREILTALADTGYGGYVVIEAGGANATRHTLDKFRILPMSTDDELMRGYFPRQALGGLYSKEDPERPTFGRD